MAPSDWPGADAVAWPAACASAFRRGWNEEHDRRPLWLPVGLAAGIAIYFALPAEPNLTLGVATGLFGIVLGAAAAAQRERPDMRAGLAMAAAVLIGFAAAKLRTDRVAAPVLAHRTGPVHFDARIVSADAHGERTRLLLDVPRIRRLAHDATPRRVRISVRMTPETLVPGTWVSVLAVLMPPPEPSSPGGYDFARWAYYQGIGAVGYAYGRPKPIAAPRPDGFWESLAARVERLRDRMTRRIRAVIPGARGAIAAALVTGKRGGIDESDQAAFRDSGLAHVLSISGLHLALAGGFFFWLVRALLALFPAIALHYPIKKWAAVAALAAAGAYLLISGCGAPAVRSYIMLSVMFAAVLFDRPALTMRSVALAAAIILLWKPESLVQPGFEMSFAAVTGLIALAEWETRRRARNADLHTAAGPLGRARRYVAGIALASIVAGLATAPFAIFHFDRASQYGLLANVLAMPVVGLVIMPSATAAMLLMPFGLDRYPLLVMGRGVGTMQAIAQWVAGLPGATRMVAVWPEVALLLVVAGGLWIALWRGPWRWFGAAPIVLGLIAAQFATAPDVLIAKNGRDVAVRLADGRLALLRAPKDDYAAASWLKRDGDARAPETVIATPRDGVRCDADGCVARLPSGFVLASALRFDALREDCTNADIVVSAVPTRHVCRGPSLVIDRFDVARGGAMAIRLGETWDVETVKDARGHRPWSEYPAWRWRTFKKTSTRRHGAVPSPLVGEEEKSRG
jgi:competence protein ComEC